MNHDRIIEAQLAAAIEAQEYNLISILKPQITVDGNKWCVLLGDNLHDGVCGFGDTPYLVILDFNKAFHKPLNKGAVQQPAVGEESGE